MEEKNCSIFIHTHWQVTDSFSFYLTALINVNLGRAG